MIKRVSATSARLGNLLLGAALILPPAAMAEIKPLPEHFAAGSDTNRDPCTATRAWTQGSGIRNEAEQPFVITCRGSTEQRGIIDVARDRLVIAPEQCGAISQVSLEGLGPVTVRRCFDPRFRGETIVIETPTARASAFRSALGPVIASLRAVRERSAAVAVVTIDPKALNVLGAPPEAAAATQRSDTIAASGLDSTSAIKQGMQRIYAGLNVEASRFLNDAVAQFATAPLMQRTEIRLGAGLADSNIGAFEAASKHFEEADKLLAIAAPSPTRTRLMTEAMAYKALHLANQGKWQAVLDLLARAEARGAALTDPTTLARLNESTGHDLQAGLDTDQINALILVAQQDVARSNAYLRLRRRSEAVNALQRAKIDGVDAAEAVLKGDGRSSAGGLNWLRASLERQQGRIRQSSGDVDGAIASFDCAIATMHAVAPPVGRQCLFPNESAARDVALTGPSIADAELERTAILSTKPGVDRATILAQYEQAVTTLAEASGGVATPSPLLARYLQMLVEDSTRGDASATERYFRALQTVREPGIAREYAALQSVVSNGASGGLIRERQDLERRQAQLRYEIATLAPDAPRLTAARDERDQVSADLEKVKAELGQSGVAGAIDDAPVTIAALQAGLRPGEAYLKLSDVGGRVFGMVVTQQAPVAYLVDRSASDVAADAKAVLASSRSQRGNDGLLRILPFDGATSYKLFASIAGPAAPALTQASAIVIDTGSVLDALPAAVLVTAPTPASTAVLSDYGKIAFLVQKAELASALSPRAFMRVRTGLAASRAPQKLIGFGDNAPPPEPISAAVADTAIAVAPTCSVRYGTWVAQMRGTSPIPVDEIRGGAAEIGDPNAPIVTGADFTDGAVLAASGSGKLAQYQVLHFATHGIPATRVEGMCETPLPPSLITSVVAPTPGAPSPSNGLLSYIDVARLDLDANLVILSACDTASSVSTELGRLGGQEESAPTLDGLVRAFIIAQARAVMATYWRVNATQGTNQLIATFYKVGRESGMGHALQQAQLSVLAKPKTSHPYYWAAFFLVGDGAKPMLTKAPVIANR